MKKSNFSVSELLIAVVDVFSTISACKYFKAIFKARRAFKAWKHEFDEDRRKIQASRVKEEIPQVYNLSIIWQYYAKGKKLFSQL